MDRSVLLLRMFRFLETKASDRIVAEVEAVLVTGQLLTVRAGGIGYLAGPAGVFEVMLDHDPPRFWTKYGNSRQTLYTGVPKLMICHHIIRTGGIAHIGYIYRPTPGPSRVEMRISAPENTQHAIETLVGALDGVRIDEVIREKAPI